MQQLVCYILGHIGYLEYSPSNFCGLFLLCFRNLLIEIQTSLLVGHTVLMVVIH